MSGWVCDSPVEMAPDKVMKLLFGFGMEILELVHCTELDNVETIGQYQIYQGDSLLANHNHTHTHTHTPHTHHTPHTMYLVSS